MERSCKDYRSWHLQNLTDHTKAAYFMMAALEDALEIDLPKHFLKAIFDVRKANGSTGNPFVYMMTHVKSEDIPAIYDMMIQIAGAFVEKAEQENLAEFEYS